MNFLQRLILKGLFNSPDFDKIKDNPFYQSYNIRSGWQFSDFSTQMAIEKGYAGNADLYAIVKKIASTAAYVPLCLYEYQKDGEKIKIDEGELYELIQQPNRFQSINEFIEESITFLLLSGNTYIHGYKSEGFGNQIRELNVLPSQYITIEGGGMIDPIKKYWYEELYSLSFEPDQIMHVKYPNPKGEGVERLYGLSPLEAGNYALQSSNNVYEAKGNIIKNQGVSGILTNRSERSLRKEDVESMQEKWEELNSNTKKFGRTLTTSANLDFLQLGLSPEHLQLLEMGVFDLRSLCRIYSIDAKLFGDEAASTYNNMLDARKAMYTDAILPNLNLWLNKFNNFFIKSWAMNDKKDYWLEADTSEIEVLQSDQKLEAEKDKIRMEGVKLIIEMAASTEAKVQLLVSEYGFTEQDAEALVAPVGSVKPTLEVLKSLSPLLANKLVEKLSDEEIRQMLI